MTHKNLFAERNYATAFILIALGILCRVMPHPSNFTPLVAIALFSGTVLTPGMALTVPLIAMIASDLWIGPHDLFWLTWSSFFAVTFLGFWTAKNPGWLRIFLGTLAGSLLFFITTNLGVFFFQQMYPKTPAGLLECFWMALPFFKNSLLGDLFYSFVFFGLFAASGFFIRRSLRQSA